MSEKTQGVRIVLPGNGMTDGTKVYVGEYEISDVLNIQIDLKPQSPVTAIIEVIPSAIEGLENMEGVFITQVEFDHE